MLKSLPIILMVVFICSQSFAMLPQESASWQGEVKMAAAGTATGCSALLLFILVDIY